MDDFEAQVKKGLRSLPGKGLTEAQRTEVLRRSTEPAPSTFRRWRQRRLNWIGKVAAIIVPAGLATVFGVELLQSRTSASHPAVNQSVQVRQIENLLAKYGWHEAGRPGTEWTTKLPKSYVLRPGNVPIGLYWGYHNVLSKRIGLDITPYLGQTVRVEAIPLKENWKIGPPEESTDAIVIITHGKVIGAWISKGQEHYIVDICESLNHQVFGDITGQTWGNWVAQQKLVDYSAEAYAKRLKWTPKQLMQAYFTAVNQHHYSSAYGMLSTMGQYQTITINVPAGHLYNTQWDPIKGDGLSNWSTAKFDGMKPYKIVQSNALSSPTLEDKLYNDRDAIDKGYTVHFNVTFRNPAPLNSGPNMYFTTITKESADAPWSIGGFGTGP